MKARPSALLMLTTLLVAALLDILPLTAPVAHWRPDWLALTVLYWCLAAPQRFNIGSAWLAGLILDLLLGGLLGQHALAMIVMAYPAVRLSAQFPLFSVLQQLLLVAAALALYRGMLMWIYGVSGAGPLDWAFWAPLVSNVLLWPWLDFGLRRLLRRGARETAGL